jgi:hypothetical protein
VTALRRSVDLWVDQPRFDYVVTALAVASLTVVDPSGLVGRASWGDLYQTLASVSGILLSLGTIIVTLLFTVTPNDRLERVIRIVGHRLLRLVMSSLTALVVTTIGFVALFGLEGATGEVRTSVTSALVSMMLLRFARLWWLVDQVMRVLVNGMGTSPAQPWVKPTIEHGDYEVPRRRGERSSAS